MTATEQAHVATVRRYLQALERGATGAPLAAFFTPDAVQIEWPNRLNPRGGQSNLAQLLQRAERAPQLLAQQRYELHSVLARDASVAVEARWTATLAVALGDLSAGAAMTAHLALFFEFENGLIRQQRNHDCFEPW